MRRRAAALGTPGLAVRDELLWAGLWIPGVAGGGAMISALMFLLPLLGSVGSTIGLLLLVGLGVLSLVYPRR